MKLIIPTIVFSVALTTPVSAGHSRHGYFDGSQSMDGRYTVSPRRIDTKDKNDRLTDYHWVYTWTDTKTGKTIEGKLQGIRSGSSNVFDPVNAHIFVAPDGETFAVWNPQSMAPDPENKRKKLKEVDRKGAGYREFDGFSTAVALDAGGGTSFTDPKARNYVPEYGKKTKAIRESLKLRLVQGGLNTKKFRDSLDQLKISYDYFQLPKDIAAYPAGSCCLNKKDPTRKFLHSPICMTENAWGVATWAFIEKNTLRERN